MYFQGCYCISIRSCQCSCKKDARVACQFICDCNRCQSSGDIDVKSLFEALFSLFYGITYMTACFLDQKSPWSIDMKHTFWQYKMHFRQYFILTYILFYGSVMQFKRHSFACHGSTSFPRVDPSGKGCYGFICWSNIIGKLSVFWDVISFVCC